jgi:hypothetical protein
MIVLFTDFGLHGPYTGQMKAVLHQMAPGPVIDLFADAPVGNPKASAYLLAAYAEWFVAMTVFLCVVDPGVGGTRPAIIVEADGRWYVGPGNGLFELVERRAASTRTWDIDWKPARLSASFHGRDLFAPVAAMLARGEPPPGQPCKDTTHRRTDWPDDLSEVVYVDHFGNTALIRASCASDFLLRARPMSLARKKMTALATRTLKPDRLNRRQLSYRVSANTRQLIAKFTKPSAITHSFFSLFLFVHANWSQCTASFALVPIVEAFVTIVGAMMAVARPYLNASGSNVDVL